MSYFSTYNSVQVNLHQFKYEPLKIVLTAYRELKQTQSIDSLHAEINKECRTIINRLISGKAAYKESINHIRELCKKKRTNTCRLLYRSIEFINFTKIASQLLESFYLEKDIDHINVFVDSIEHWKALEIEITQLGLESVFSPICKQDLKNKYFKNPVLFFALPQWLESTLVIPPSSELNFIYPSDLDSAINIENHITSNNGQSLELITIDIEIKKNLIEVEPLPQFYDLFPKEILLKENLTRNIEGCIEDFERDPVRTLSVKTSSGNKLIAHKTYLAIGKDDRISFSSFENESDLNGVEYIVSSIDDANATTQSLLKEQSAIMEIWKKPLRDSLKNATLVKQLKSLGAEKASEQNIKNWADPSRIAPRGVSDFRAVLKFAGIDSEEQIKNYFYLAYKQRGDSISIGHKRSYLVNEIVKRKIQEKINKGELMAGEYYSHGIIFQVEGVNV